MRFSLVISLVLALVTSSAIAAEHTGNSQSKSKEEAQRKRDS